ncbi:MAG: VPLPA-CTERM sorting domain-containing protein [Pseudomonadota bacterium]
MISSKTMLAGVLLLSASLSGQAWAVSTFTETFNTDDSNWLDGTSQTPIYNATGGIDDSGFISYLAPPFNSGGGGFGDPLLIMFRGNDANDASGGAFVGDWLASGVTSFSVAVRHNADTALNFYARLAGFGGAGASLSNDSIFEIAPDTWTTISFDIVDSDPPFVSYGSSTFEGVFSNILNLQLGLYLPENTDFDSLMLDLDNVSITAVPLPAAAWLFVSGLVSLLAGARRKG